MPNIKSSIKRVKTAAKANLQNTAQRSAMRTTVRKADAALLNKEENASEALVQAVRALDKAAAKGLIHKKTAARKKSRLMKKA